MHLEGRLPGGAEGDDVSAARMVQIAKADAARSSLEGAYASSTNGAGR